MLPFAPKQSQTEVWHWEPLADASARQIPSILQLQVARVISLHFGESSPRKLTRR